MGQTSSAGGLEGLSGDGRTPEEAVERLMKKLDTNGPGHYSYCWGTQLKIQQTVMTAPEYYETNLVLREPSNNHARANVQQMQSATGQWFYRAFFSGLLC